MQLERAHIRTWQDLGHGSESHAVAEPGTEKSRVFKGVCTKVEGDSFSGATPTPRKRDGGYIHGYLIKLII